MTRRGLSAAIVGLLTIATAGLPSDGAAQGHTFADLTRASQAMEATGGNGLFGSFELRSDSLQGLPQWARVLAAMEEEQEAFERCVQGSAECVSPALKNWGKIITAAAGLTRREQLTAVNDFFNRWPYKLDQEIYGRSEYWATPREFMTRSGDCEDYSIAKYFALRKLGISRDEMRIVILMDEIRGIGHAVLAVYVDDDILILDSLSNLIVSHTRYKHYAPQYSMNEVARWAHIGGFKRQSEPPYQGLAARR